MTTEFKLGENWLLREDDATGDIVIQDRINTQDLFSMPSGAGPIDFSAGGKNLRMATGAAIEDGGGISRVSLSSLGTNIIDDAGTVRFGAPSGSEMSIRATADSDLRIEDLEGSFDAVKYLTSASTPGTMSFLGANINMDNNFIDNASTIFFQQASSDPKTRWDPTTTGLRLVDDDGGFTPLQYRTSSSAPGELELSSAEINMQGNAIYIGDTSDRLQIRGKSGGGRPYLDLGAPGEHNNQTRVFTGDGVTSANDAFEVNVFDSGGQTTAALRIHNANPLVDIPNSNLRIDTGRVIEDGAGQGRFGIFGSATQISDDSGATAISLEDGDRWEYRASNTEPIIWYDNQGGFDAVKYLTASSPPGTLELTNANLDLARNLIVGTGQQQIGFNSITLSDTNQQPVTLNGNATAGVLLVTNGEDNKTEAFLHAPVGQGQLTQLGSSGAFTTTSGNQGTTNVFFNSNSDLVIENETGSSKTYNYTLLNPGV